MTKFKRLVGFFVVFIAAITIMCTVSFAENNKFLIFDVYDHYDDNCSAIQELELFDNENNKIDYNILQDSYDSVTKEIPTHWNRSSLWDKTGLNDGNKEYSSSNSTIFNYYSDPNSRVWSRFVISIDSGKDVSNIKIWTGPIRIPKKVAVYEADSYDLNTNIKGRANINLSLLGECNVPMSTNTIVNEIDTKNLTANTKYNEVNLSWKEVTGAIGYSIKRSTTSGGPFETMQSNIQGTTYTDTNVTTGTTYYYVVTAINDHGQSQDSNEVSATPIELEVKLAVTAPDKTRVGDEITANIVIHNATNICAEDIKIAYDTSKLQFIGTEGVNGIKIFKEVKISETTLRYITACLGKTNAANGDKILIQLKFKAIDKGEAKIDITNGRIADNATLEMDVDQDNCGEKTVLIEPVLKDVNRTGGYTLLDLGIDAWYYGDLAANTDTSKYDADQIINGAIDDDDLNEIVTQILGNNKYFANIN